MEFRAQIHGWFREWRAEGFVGHRVEGLGLGLRKGSGFSTEIKGQPVQGWRVMAGCGFFIIMIIIVIILIIIIVIRFSFWVV